MTLLAVSHRQQSQQSDCLAACSAMVLDYLLVPYTYPQLMQRLQIQSFGTWFRNLSGLESYGLFVTIEELGSIGILKRHLESGLPPIVYVDTEYLMYWNETTNHAVVVIGIEEDQIHLNDPFFPTAPQVVTLDEFLPAWIEQKQLYAVIGLTEID
ncbi:C39 family peptidase [Chloroflexi bacterium TSY]|nr:C39 family peptidase [Chloroflexi bacterium TSY]